MYIFGGILELTKELNEMLCYNFESKSFEVIGNGSNEQAQVQAELPQNASPTKLGNS